MPRNTIARYTVRPGEEEANSELVRAVYAELAERRPEGLRYATFRLEDGRTFVHVARTEGDGAPLTSLKSFQAFQAGLRERTEDGPFVLGGEEIGSYGG